MLKAIMRFRVEWCHCDPAGIIFNPHYYIWMDQGTHQLFYGAGFNIGEHVKTTPFRGMPLVASGLNFHTPAYYNDIVELHSQIENFGNKSFRMQHQFFVGKTLLADGHEIRVWGWSDTQNPQKLTAIPIPEDIKKLVLVDKIVDRTP